MGRFGRFPSMFSSAWRKEFDPHTNFAMSRVATVMFVARKPVDFVGLTTFARERHWLKWPLKSRGYLAKMAN
jgi:hypothetical protein